MTLDQITREWAVRRSSVIVPSIVIEDNQCFIELNSAGAYKDYMNWGIALEQFKILISTYKSCECISLRKYKFPSIKDAEQFMIMYTLKYS